MVGRGGGGGGGGGGIISNKCIDEKKIKSTYNGVGYCATKYRRRADDTWPTVGQWSDPNVG